MSPSLQVQLLEFTSLTYQLSLTHQLSHKCMGLCTRRVAVVGNVDAGKSTLLGVLTHGELDNGRGFARQKLFRHKHEIESGRTSSVGNDILGFDSEGNVVNKPDSHGGSLEWTKICEKSTKVITFIDLAGHEKYLKTTVFGMTGHLPDFCMLMVSEVLLRRAGGFGSDPGIWWYTSVYNCSEAGAFWFRALKPDKNDKCCKGARSSQGCTLIFLLGQARKRSSKRNQGAICRPLLFFREV